MKTLSKIVLALYLLTLLWLVLFKFSFDISGVLLDHQARSLNLIPFADYSQGLREMVDNLVVFVPFGLLLGVVFKQTDFWRKLLCVFAFSFVAEITQFVLAIGRTDITDIITNTLGGLAGLGLYGLGSKYIDTKKLDWFIVVTGAILLVTLIFFRVFVLKVRY
jgi:glycopeptide antibiotics resistance protein